jgi:hypothetical protein
MVPPSETGPVPVDIVELEPHFFGIPPPLLTFVLATGALVGAIVLLILERFVVGGVLAALSLALFALFLGLVRRRRRRPTTAFVVASSRLLDRVSARLVHVLASTLAWSRARRELLSRRQKGVQLASRREQALRALGQAAYRRDRKEIAARRAAVQAIDDRLDELEREMQEIVEHTREDLREEHAAALPTEAIMPDRAEVEGEGDQV